MNDPVASSNSNDGKDEEMMAPRMRNLVLSKDRREE